MKNNELVFVLRIAIPCIVFIPHTRFINLPIACRCVNEIVYKQNERNQQQWFPGLYVQDTENQTNINWDNRDTLAKAVSGNRIALEYTIDEIKAHEKGWVYFTVAGFLRASFTKGYSISLIA